MADATIRHTRFDNHEQPPIDFGPFGALAQLVRATES
jgi:hypothetical protein